MWGNSSIDVLLNPKYGKISSYKDLLSLLGIQIIINNGTRNEDKTGEAHFLLLRKDNRLGLLIVHDKFLPGLPPMYCIPHEKSVIQFHKKLKEAIQWFDEPSDLKDFLRKKKHLEHPIYNEAPLVMGLFYSDVAEFLVTTYP